MKAIISYYNSKDRRSNSCLEQSSIETKNDKRTSSFTEQSLSTVTSSNELNKIFNSPNEFMERHSTPKHELYKLQKQTYQNAKKKFTSELDYILKDSSVIIINDWLKVRGTLRDWTKLWAILKPGLMLLYRNPPSMNGVWVGTIVLSSCEVIQRPSKKSGFCFKIWHSLEKSIWIQKGPNNEQFGALTFPLPMNYLICRASDEIAGRCWMDALELTMKCSKLLQKTYLSSSTNDILSLTNNPLIVSHDDNKFINTNVSDSENDLNRIIIKEDDRVSETSDDTSKPSRSGTSQSETSQDVIKNIEHNETLYILALPEEMGELGNAAQTEEIAEENRSLIIHLLKQIRPGMDLSQVVLPTFILEPRSLLEKLSDYYYHCDILEEAVNSSDPLIRMKTIVKFYLSGFYKKPKGLKKPYNPVLGEVYRCYFYHKKTDSKTYYLAEQISHHPPITNFYVLNRRENFCVQGSILAKSKFYGNSISGILDGTARITLLNRGEDYIITMPYANCKGILIGRLIMELGGKVTITCEKTLYSADIEFKLKPFMGGQELTNRIEGKIRFVNDIIYTFSGHWDDEIVLVDTATNMKSTFWKVTQSIINSRLKRYVVPIENQQNNESEKLWQRVTLAIRQNDQILATKEKTIIESEQRKHVKERHRTGIVWHPHLFTIDSNTKEWIYIHADTRPWNSHNDISTYENNFIIRTHTNNSTINKELSKYNIRKSLNNDNDTTLILKQIEENLLSINKRIELHEKQIYNLQNYHRINQQNKINFFSPYIHIILIICLLIILKIFFS